MPQTVFEVRTHDASDEWAATVCPWPPSHAGRISRQHLQECAYPVSAAKVSPLIQTQLTTKR